MKLSRRSFLTGAGAGLGVAISSGSARARVLQAADVTRLRLLRHATMIVHYGGRTLMVDPMLGEPATMPAITNSPNPRPNPLVPMPIAAAEALKGIDAVLVTHTHPDHWDATATTLVPKQATLFIQPPDAETFAKRGFAAARPIDSSVSWNGMTIARTGGQHGHGDMAKKLAPVAGFVLSRAGAPTIYIAGDTVWCPEVADAIRTHQPDVIVVNSGAAQFLEGGPITMDAADVLSVCKAAPKAKVVAVHLEAINHCVLTRSALRDALAQSPVKPSVLIPKDGEELRL